MCANQLIHDKSTDLMGSVSKGSTNLWVCTLMAILDASPANKLNL